MPAVCVHVHEADDEPNYKHQSLNSGEFELISILNWIDPFISIPIVGVFENWRSYRIPMSIPGSNSSRTLTELLVQAAYHSWEHIIYSKTISSMLEIFELHGPKLLRKKRIGGSYYYHLCEMLKDSDDNAAAATFMMSMSVGKSQQAMELQAQWETKIMKPTQLSFWTLFYELLSLNDDELEYILQMWGNMAKKWAMTMVHLMCAQKKLQKESVLSAKLDMCDSQEDKEKFREFLTGCLRAGSDQDAIAADRLGELRSEMLKIQQKLLAKIGSPNLTLYDVDMLKFYVAALVQVCSTGDLVAALVAWKKEGKRGMKNLRAQAMERVSRDMAMQGLVRQNGRSEDSYSDWETSSCPSPSISSVSSLDHGWI